MVYPYKRDKKWAIGRRRNQDPLVEEQRASERKRGSRNAYVPPHVNVGSPDGVEEGVTWLSEQTTMTSASLSFTSGEMSTDVSDLNQMTSGEMTDDTLHQHPPAFQKGLDNSDSLASGLFRGDLGAWAESEYLRQKQKLAILSIILSAGQLAVLMLQLALCGVAPLDVNPIIGPYPDAFSDWGGKNAYLLVKELQLWRFITPAFLHVGVLHLLCNAVVQLETCAYFERQWGSFRWLLIYLVSEAGCVVLSCSIDPDTIAVGSSGALAGLFGAKLAQSLAACAFEVTDESDDVNLNASQVVGMLCMFTLVALMSALSYVEWSGHVGGLVAGFFAGFLFLSASFKTCCSRFILVSFGLIGLALVFTFSTMWLFTEVEPYEELADSCQYFRQLFAEGYDCQCLWD